LVAGFRPQHFAERSTVNQRFTLDRQSFEHVLAAASLFQSLQQKAVSRTLENNPPVLQYSLETLRAVDSGTLDLQSSLEQVAGLALQIVGGDGAVALLFTSDSLVCRAAVGKNFDDDHIRTALRSRLQSAGAFETNPPSTLDLTRTLATYSTALGSSLAIALLPGRRIAGALAVFSDPSRTFTERNYSNLRLLAGLGQYVLRKWMAKQEQESLDPKEESGERTSLQTQIASLLGPRLGRSARAPLMCPADPSSIPSGPIPDLYVPGLGTRAGLGGSPNDRSQFEPELQSVSTSRAREGLDVNSAHGELGVHSSDMYSPGARSSSDYLADPHAQQTNPGGADRNSAALHRWEEWKKRLRSQRDDWVTIATRETPLFVRRLKIAGEAAKNILRRGRNVRVPWRAIGQAVPAVAILAVMSFFVGLLTGNRQPLAVGSLNSVAQAAAEPVMRNSGTNGTQNAASILTERKSMPATGPTSHLQITDREAAATIADLSRYEIRNLHKIAAYGDDEAALELGMLYEVGRGFPQNCSKAAEWVTRAAQNGNVAAEYNLGLRYKDGDGVPANLQQAETWLRKAVSHKYPNGASVLAELPAQSKEQSVSQIPGPPQPAMQTP
jgi:hypothetical protein